ncbi:uncharacterized protein J3D65DRAFT_666783 [Phyllosticta citribraziliensis]|uniref:Uncharacterized protein n=1 Tax=Phyllosticta citribraziliensis TaxID=989973 RepID=A0ABR1LSA8_9PEZI
MKGSAERIDVMGVDPGATANERDIEAMDKGKFSNGPERSSATLPDPDAPSSINKDETFVNLAPIGSEFSCGETTDAYCHTQYNLLLPRWACLLLGDRPAGILQRLVVKFALVLYERMTSKILSKDEVFVSTMELPAEMEENSEGRDALVVLGSMVLAAQVVKYVKMKNGAISAVGKDAVASPRMVEK